MNHERSNIPFVHDTGLSPDMLYLYGENYRPQIVLIPAAGEVCPDTGAVIVNEVLKLRNLTTKIGIDTRYPEYSARKFPWLIRKGVTGMLRSAFPQTEPVHPQQTTVIFEQLIKSNDKVDILITGPATDIARFIESYDPSEISKHVNHIYMMGGAIDGNGNEHDFDFTRVLKSMITHKIPQDRSTREWNLMVDPISVHTILQSGIPFTIVPLEAVSEITFSRDMYNAFSRAPANLAEEKLKQYVIDLQKNIDRVHQPFPMWDTATVMFRQNTNLGKIIDINVHVNTDPYDREFGRIVRNNQTGTNVQVCTLIDPDKMRQYIMENIWG